MRQNNEDPLSFPNQLNSTKECSEFFSDFGYLEVSSNLTNSTAFNYECHIKIIS